MNIQKQLTREGIEIIEKVDTLNTNVISRKVSDALSNTFPNLGLTSQDLFRKLSRLNMYFAKLPQGISAKYFYKNKTIYFDEKLKDQNITSVVIHECIHYLQEKYSKTGNITRLGLCDYTNHKLPGIGLNEAAVQLMATKCIGSKYQEEKYFGINIQTNTPTYYPLECALVNQMAYVIGEDVLFDSTINANDGFKEQFISLTSKDAFNTIEKNIDLLVEKQENLAILYSNMQENGTKVTGEIETLKEKIKNLFLSTQELILTCYFDNAINLAYTSRQLENYRNKLYLFKNLIGETEGYNFYNEYYRNKMMDIEKRYEIDGNEIQITDLAEVNHGFVWTLIRKIRTLLGLEFDYR